MTYCVGLDLADGLVLLADTRTNAGVDNISTFSKLHVFERGEDRVLALMSAGNLAISQSVLNVLQEQIADSENAGAGAGDSLMSVGSMFKAAQLVGEAIRTVFAVDGEAMQAQNVTFDVSFLLGGQIRGRQMRLFQIYAAGNFIEATPDTPFLQVGEHKYGKPILDRAAGHDMPLVDGIKLALISMDSTLRSNLTVGLPVDLAVLRRDALAVSLRRRITEQDPYFLAIREQWSEALRNAYKAMPVPEWEL